MCSGVFARGVLGSYVIGCSVMISKLETAQLSLPAENGAKVLSWHSQPLHSLEPHRHGSSEAQYKLDNTATMVINPTYLAQRTRSCE